MWTLWLLFLVVCICCLAASRREGFSTISDDETIFVSCASFRDTECLATVRDAFAKARNKGRVFFGICEQNKDRSESCAVDLGANAARVKVMSLSHLEAKGPTYARYLCATLYDNQDFVLQIDSHTRFEHGWDDQLIKSLKRCPSQKAVLSHYPHSHGVSIEEMQSQIPVMCKSKWNADGLPVFEAVMQPSSQAGLRATPFIAGGMLFARGSMLNDVRMDPNLPFLFQSEEILYSARLWTHGYDIYTPDVNVITHHYTRENSPRFWDDLHGYRHVQRASLARVRQLLCLRQPYLVDDEYGMGRSRRLQAYWEFAGLDSEKKTSESQQKFCM